VPRKLINCIFSSVDRCPHYYQYEL